MRALARNVGPPILFAAFFLLAGGSAATALADTGEPVLAQIEELELVESVPVETDLDNKTIRNTLDVWLEMIGKATKTLDLEQFYVSNVPGEPLEEVLKAIMSAADRGVQVRFVVDAGMYKTYPEMLDSLTAMKNIGVRKIDMRQVSGGPMHAKYFVVDGKELFVGSQNFDWRALKHIHEMGCRVRSAELCEIFTDLFELDWQLAEMGRLQGEQNKTGEAKVSKRETAAGDDTTDGCGMVRQYALPLACVVEVPFPRALRADQLADVVKETIQVWPVYSPGACIPDERLWDEKRLVSLIDGARSDVLVQLLTYSALDDTGYYDVLDNALRRAAARGVAVKLLVSDWAKVAPKIDCLKSLEVLPNIEVKLSTIPQWSGGFVPYARVEHCKYMVVDGKVSWIGTSNWERNYFHEARNVGLVLEGNSIGKMLHDVFFKSWNSKYAFQVRPEITYTPPKRNDPAAPR
jgi:phosphatidylserine/phosphatidylglycerophosphate/cardiolipin synthase-like enzyme